MKAIWLVPPVMLLVCVVGAAMRMATSGPSVTANAEAVASAEKSRWYNDSPTVAAPDPNFVPATQEEVAAARNRTEKLISQADQIRIAITSGSLRPVEARLVSGTMPLIATITQPGESNIKTAVYDLGKVYAAVHYTTNPRYTRGNPELLVSLDSSVDGTSWTGVIPMNHGLVANTVGILPQPARYVRWTVRAADSSGVLVGTYTVSLSGVRFYR